MPRIETRASLLIRVKDPRDDDAWGTFDCIYAPMILRWCRRIGLRIEDAEDVTQRVLSQLSVTLRGFEYRPETGSFRSWLFTLVRRETARYLDRERRSNGHAADCGPLTAEVRERTGGQELSAWMDEFAAQVYHTAQERVRPEFDAISWQAFQLHWKQDLPARDVADRVGRPLAWVYKAKYRVLQRLEVEVRYLAEDLPMPPRIR